MRPDAPILGLLDRAAAGEVIPADELLASGVHASAAPVIAAAEAEAKQQHKPKPKKGADKPKAEAADKGAKARGAGRSSARAPADRPLAGGGTSKAPDGGDWLRTDVRAPPSNPAALTVAPVLPDAACGGVKAA